MPLPLRCSVGVLLLAAAVSGFAAADTSTASIETIPAGTRVKFHLTSPVSSDRSKTGDSFKFALLAPVDVEGRTLLPAGTLGTGTVYLAGKAGSSGHEGDLTLRLDSMQTPDGRYVTFADQRFQINGQNRKILSAILGFVPYAGVGATFIHGADVRVDASRIVETVLQRPATITLQPPPAPSPPASSPPARPSPPPASSPPATPSASPSAPPR